MASAMATVLSMPELLEAVFLQCDMRSVLTSTQRVCRQWRDIVVSSPAVQTHLYFRPGRGSPSNADAGDNDDDDDVPVLNPLLAKVFPPFFEPLVVAAAAAAAAAASASEGLWGRAEIASLPLARDPAPFMREGASWRTMHVQQPPLRALGVAVPSEDSSVVHERRGDSEDAIRMSDLYDHVIRALTSPGQRWRVLWSWRDAPVLQQQRLEGRGVSPTTTTTTTTGEEGGSPADFTAPCTRELLREAGAVLVRGSDPLRSVAIMSADRDFMARFTHPAALRPRSLEDLARAPPRRIRGRMSRREQREL